MSPTNVAYTSDRAMGVDAIKPMGVPYAKPLVVCDTLQRMSRCNYVLLARPLGSVD